MAGKKGIDHEEIKKLLLEYDLSAVEIAKKFGISRRMVYYVAGSMGLDMDERTIRIRAQPLVTEDMVSAAMIVLRDELFLPYAADVRDFTKEDVQAGLLREADEAANKQNRDLIRRALEAALTSQ